jgi:hypothetical protein
VALRDLAQRDFDVPAFEQRAPVEVKREARRHVERLEQQHRGGVGDDVTVAEDVAGEEGGGEIQAFVPFRRQQ